MDTAEYYAHQREDGTLQTVLEHLEGTAEYARAFGKAACMEEEAAYAAMAHDLGKFTPGFQRRLLAGGGKVDHATAGMIEALSARHNLAAFAIAGHHAGLPDLGTPADTQNDSTLRGKSKRKSGGKIEDYSCYHSFLNLIPPPPLPDADASTDFLRTKMLYSCLVDADWLDTERFVFTSDSKNLEITVSITVGCLQKSLNTAISLVAKLLHLT